MVVINGIKYACERCIRGHRVTTCTHTDQPLTMIKPKGRPALQCQHCREQRKVKNQHNMCKCGKKSKATGTHLPSCLCYTTLHCTCGAKALAQNIHHLLALEKAKRQLLISAANAEVKKKSLSPKLTDDKTVVTSLQKPGMGSSTFTSPVSDPNSMLDGIILPFEGGDYDLFASNPEKHDYFGEKQAPSTDKHPEEFPFGVPQTSPGDLEAGDSMFPLFPLVGQFSFEHDQTNPLLGLDHSKKDRSGTSGHRVPESHSGPQSSGESNDGTNAGVNRQSSNKTATQIYGLRNGSGNVTNGSNENRMNSTHVDSHSNYLNSNQANQANQANSNKVNANQINQVNSNQVNSNQMNSNQVNPNQMNPNQMNSNQVNSNRVNSNQVNSTINANPNANQSTNAHYANPIYNGGANLAYNETFNPYQNGSSSNLNGSSNNLNGSRSNLGLSNSNLGTNSNVLGPNSEFKIQSFGEYEPDNSDSDNFPNFPENHFADSHFPEANHLFFSIQEDQHEHDFLDMEGKDAQQSFFDTNFHRASQKNTLEQSLNKDFRQHPDIQQGGVHKNTQRSSFQPGNPGGFDPVLMYNIDGMQTGADPNAGFSVHTSQSNSQLSSPQSNSFANLQGIVGSVTLSPLERKRQDSFKKDTLKKLDSVKRQDSLKRLESMKNELHHVKKTSKTHQPKPLRPHAASNASLSSVVSTTSSTPATTHYQPIRPKRPESVLSVASNSLNRSIEHNILASGNLPNALNLSAFPPSSEQMHPVASTSAINEYQHFGNAGLGSSFLQNPQENQLQDPSLSTSLSYINIYPGISGVANVDSIPPDQFYDADIPALQDFLPNGFEKLSNDWIESKRG